MDKFTTPLVSVLMTVFNREKYIMEAIESVIVSTYQNWELIIVDDQSKDKSVEIAQSYAAKDDRIKVFINEINHGDYPNRNKAATYAQGKYLKYVDADDKIYSYGLERLVYYMEQFPKAGYGLCSLKQDIAEIYPFSLSPEMAYQRHYNKNMSLFDKAPLSSIIKTSAFKQVGGFSGKQHLGDFEMWHTLSQYFPVVLMPHGMVWYRQHDDQQMSDNRSNPIIPFKYLLLGAKLVRKEDCPMLKSEQLIAESHYKNKQALSILSAFKHFGVQKGMQLKKASGLSMFEILKRVSI